MNLHRDSKIIAFGAVLAILFGVGAFVSVKATDEASANPPYKMVPICHTDDGGESYHEIVIPKWKVPDHVEHGDIYPVPENGCPKHEHPPPTTTEPPPTTTEPPPTTTEPPPTTTEPPTTTQPPQTTTDEQPPPTTTTPDNATPPPARPNGPGPPNTNLPHTGGDEWQWWHWIVTLVGLGMLGAGAAAFVSYWKGRKRESVI